MIDYKTNYLLSNGSISSVTVKNITGLLSSVIILLALSVIVLI